MCSICVWRKHKISEYVGIKHVGKHCVVHSHVGISPLQRDFIDLLRRFRAHCRLCGRCNIGYIASYAGVFRQRYVQINAGSRAYLRIALVVVHLVGLDCTLHGY